MKDFRIMYDYETSDVHDSGSVGEDWGGIVSHPEYPAGMISIISVNCTTINQEFNPNDPENNSLFAFDPIRYMCYGNEKFRCLYDIWTDAGAEPEYVELKGVIEMRRQTTDFFDQEGLAGKAAPKVYTWDTPDKEQINNYQAFDVGMNQIGFRFNVNQQTRAVVKFKTFGNVIDNVGGFKASVVSVFAGVYVFLCAKLIKYNLLTKIDGEAKKQAGSRTSVSDKLGVTNV